MEELRDGDPLRLGPYRLRARLGEGGMGEVFLGVSPSGVRVAVKTVRPEFAMDHGFRDRFRREIELARRVDSAWTAPIAEADPDARPPWLATEYLTGLSLSAAIAAYGPLPESALRMLGAQLAEALMAIHRAGLIHRDLKPSNVILGRDRLRVIDFGISRAADEVGAGLTGTGRVVGSPAFMSPEQAGGLPLGPESDVFSLGSVLVFAAAGHGPFHGDSVPQLQMMLRVLNDDPDLSQVPLGFRDLVASCLSRRAGDRPTPADVLARCVGDVEPPSGGSWLPPALAAELERRHVGDAMPARNVPPPPTRAEPSQTADDARAPITATATTVEPPPDARPTRVGAPPPPPARPPTVGMPREVPRPGGGLGRRAFLLGGSAVAVVAAGGAAGWFLLGDAAEPGKPLWSAPGLVSSGSAVVPAGDLVYQIADGGGGGTGQVCAIDAESGRVLWKRPTAGDHVSDPLVTDEHVLVVSWSIDTGIRRKMEEPAKCTVHAFDREEGVERWTLTYDTRRVHLPDALEGDVLYLTVAEQNSYTTTPGRLLAIDARTHAQRWEASMPKSNGNPGRAVVVGDLITVAAAGNNGSDGRTILAYRPTGDVAWQIPFAEEPFGQDIVVLPDMMFALTGKQSHSGSKEFTWRRQALAVADGAGKWGPFDFATGSVWPAIAGTDVVFVAGDAPDEQTKAILFAFSTDNGGEKWRYEMPGYHVTQVTLSKKLVYIANSPSPAQAGIPPTTSPSASARATTATTTTGPPVAPVVSSTVYALEADSGNVRWSYETGSAATPTQPVLDGDRVYVSYETVAGKPARLIALDADTGRLVWAIDASDSKVSRPATSRDNVYLARWKDGEADSRMAVVDAYER